MSNLSEKAFSSIFNRSGELGSDRLIKAIHSTGDDMVMNHRILQGISFGMKQHEKHEVYDAVLKKNNLHKHSLDILHHTGTPAHKAMIKTKYPKYKPSTRENMSKRRWHTEISDIQNDEEIRSNGLYRK